MLVVGVALVHDVRVTGFQLDRGDLGQHVARAHQLSFLNPLVGEQLVVHHVQVHVVQMSAVSFIYTVRTEHVKRFVVLGQLIKTVRHDQPDRQGFQANPFVGVDFFAVQKFRNVPAENVVVPRARSFALTHLVGIGKSVLHQLQHRHDPFGRAFHAFDRLAASAQLRQVYRYAAADFGQLHAGVQHVVDRVQRVVHFQQETGHHLAAPAFARVQERRRRRPQPLLHHGTGQQAGGLRVAAAEVQRHRRYPVRVMLQILGLIVRLQRVVGIKLRRRHIRRKLKMIAVGNGIYAFDLGFRILLVHVLVIIVFDHVPHFIGRTRKGHAFAFDFLHKFGDGFPVLLQLEEPALVPLHQHVVQFNMPQPGSPPA